MPRHFSTRTCLATATFLTLALGLAVAQAPAVKRTVLQRADISVPGREVVTAKAEIPPSGGTGRHTHPGEEVSYVLDGVVSLEVDGQPARTLKAGDVFIIPAGQVHGATNRAPGVSTIIANYIVDKDKPLTTQVP